MIIPNIWKVIKFMFQTTNLFTYLIGDGEHDQKISKARVLMCFAWPIGSTYGIYYIYANIWGILMVNVAIYIPYMDPMGDEINLDHEKVMFGESPPCRGSRVAGFYGVWLWVWMAWPLKSWEMWEVAGVLKLSLLFNCQAWVPHQRVSHQPWLARMKNYKLCNDDTPCSHRRII